MEKQSCFEAWKAQLKYILNNGYDFVDRDKRTCREVLNLFTSVLCPEKEITKPIKVLNSFGKWAYPSISELTDVMFVKKTTPYYDYCYGPRLFNFHEKISQINKFVVPLMEKDPTSRRAVVTIWNPVSDSFVNKKTVPGLIAIDFKLRNSRMNVTAIIRSNDVFFGWPANIYQIYTLQDYVRKKLNCEFGTLNTFSTSAHIFKDQFDYIKKVLLNE